MIILPLGLTRLGGDWGHGVFDQLFHRFIEALSILSRQCLDRRIADLQTLTNEVSAWVETRNQQQTWIDWRFTTEDARLKLKRLYLSINP